jgi:GNAT superfamily N-acetyltransferase
VTGGAHLTVEREPFDSPSAQALVDALMADLDARYAADGPGEGDNPEIAGAWSVRAEQVTPPRGAFFVARLGDRPVGCGAVRRVIAGAPPDVAEIKRMYVAPAARGRGVARALLARLEAEAAALGYRILQLETGMRQPEAILLYKSAGYHRIAGYGQYATDELSLCFAKRLPPGRTRLSGTTPPRSRRWP